MKNEYVDIDINLKDLRDLISIAFNPKNNKFNPRKK